MKRSVFFFLLLTLPVIGFAQKTSYAHVETDSIIAAWPEAIEAEKNIQAKARRMQEEFNKEQDRLQKYYAAIMSSDTTNAAKEKMLVDLQKQRDAYLVKADEADKKLFEEQQEVMKKLVTKVGAAIEIVAEREKIDYVFDISNSQVWYYDGGRDITGLVMKELGISGN